MFRRRRGILYSGISVPLDSLWNSVVFLARFNGIEGATTWADESLSAHGSPSTWGGTAVIDEDNPLYSESTLLLDGNSDYVAWSDSADWLMGSEVAFCIESWVYLPSNTDAVKTIVSQYRADNSQRSWRFNVQDDAGGNVFRFVWSLNGVAASTIDSDASCPAGEWVHAAVTRTSAGTINMWINGVKQVEEATSVTAAFHNSTHTLDLGRVFSTSGIHFWPGSLADVRITKGDPRYTANFSSPTTRLPVKGTS